MVIGEFDEEILSDLIDMGYEGQELLEKFKEIRSNVPKAMETMLDELIAQSNGEFYSLEEVFASE